jgi:hypothetical protein
MAQAKPLVVWYEPHPVTPERKKELVAAGYRIVDARYAPPGWVATPTYKADLLDLALTPTGVRLTDADAAADLKGEPRPDNQGRSSWAENEPPLGFMGTEAAATVVPAEPNPFAQYDAEVAARGPTAYELRAKLDAAGIEYRKHAPKSELIELAAGI